MKITIIYSKKNNFILYKNLQQLYLRRTKQQKIILLLYLKELKKKDLI